MHVVHKAEDPSPPVGACFAETSPDRSSHPTASSVAGNSCVSQLALLLGQPASLKWAIGEGKGCKNSNAHGNGTLNDEKPLPAPQAVGAVEARENRRGDETREGTRSHVTRVKDGHARRNFLASVEHGDHVKCTRIKRRLYETKQEAAYKHALVVDGLVGEK